MFYTAFLDAGKLGDCALAILTEKSYNAMTANGDVDLRSDQYSVLQTVISTLCNMILKCNMAHWCILYILGGIEIVTEKCFRGEIK